MLEASVAFHRRWCATIAELIRHGQERQEFTAVDPSAVAVRLAALTNGLAIRMVLDDPSASRDQYLAMSVQAAVLELGCDANALRSELAAVPATKLTRLTNDSETEEAA
jgi:hypothetical protein